MKRLILSLPLALALGFGAPQLARAASITIDDTSPDETITVSWSDFDFGGFSVNGGGPTAAGSVTVAESTGPISFPISFDGTWFAPTGPTTGGDTVYFLENTDLNYVSDVFSWAYTISDAVGHIVGNFVSDVETSLGPVPPEAHTFVEGPPYTFSAAFLTGSVTSDAEVPPPMPEPASLALLGLGLAGIGVLRRRRAR